jgi:hypothetical protein
MNTKISNLDVKGQIMNRQERVFEITRHINVLMLDSSSADEIEHLRKFLRLISPLLHKDEPQHNGKIMPGVLRNIKQCMENAKK